MKIVSIHNDKDDLILPAKWVKVLKNLPEAGMGYQIVDIYNKDGSVFEGVIIINCMYYDIPEIDPEQIERIEINK